MEAGLELNRLVAEKLGLPEGPYSEEIQYAWLVVEKMGVNFYIHLQPDSKWRAAFWIGKHWIHNPRAATAPLAICLASLRAVGVLE